MATSVGGVLTGRGADMIIIDDPLKPDEALYQRSRTDKSGSQVVQLTCPGEVGKGHIEILRSLAKLGSSGRVGASNISH